MVSFPSDRVRLTPDLVAKRTGSWADKRRLAAALALLLVAAACGTDATPDEAAGQGAEDPAGQGGNDSPDVDAGESFAINAYQGVDLLGGEEISFDSVLGNGTPVMLNFWAAQCPPCLAEMPWFEAAWQEYQDDVLLVGVDIGPFMNLGTNEQGADLLDELEITYPAAYAVDNTAILQYNVISMPTTVFFDGDGNQVGDHSGLMVESQMDDAFQQLAAMASE